jgi:hypothetical protein
MLGSQHERLAKGNRDSDEIPASGGGIRLHDADLAQLELIPPGSPVDIISAPACACDDGGAERLGRRVCR